MLSKEDLEKCKLSRKEICELAGIRYSSFNVKLNNFLNFRLDEEKKIKEIINNNLKEKDLV